MIINKITMGNREHTYPVDINKWIYDRSLFEGFIIEQDLVNLHEEARFSCKIENIDDIQEFIKINMIMDNIDFSSDLNNELDLTHDSIFEMYDLLMDSKEKTKSYRSCNVSIGGNYPPYYFDVKPLMDKFIEFSNDKSIPKEVRVILGHLYFELIHPFDDGNGRIGRIIMFKLTRGQISEYLFNNIQEYYRLLGSSSSDLVNEWIEFLKRGYSLSIN